MREERGGPGEGTEGAAAPEAQGEAVPGSPSSSQGCTKANSNWNFVARAGCCIFVF